MSGPDFSHVETWLFDLDNTLYPSSCDLFAQIDVRMTAYVARLLGIDAAEARALQKRYYVDYGTTLSGLIARHGVDARDYLDYVHDIDLTVVPENPTLDRLLAQLPGRKLVFTNGSFAHAENVVARIGIAHHFDDIFDIEAAEFIPKPAPESFQRLLHRTGLAPGRAAMFDDLARNLKEAHTLGMTTVWIRSAKSWAPPGAGDEDLGHVHHETDDLTAFLATVRCAARTG